MMHHKAAVDAAGGAVDELPAVLSLPGPGDAGLVFISQIGLCRQTDQQQQPTTPKGKSRFLLSVLGAATHRGDSLLLLHLLRFHGSLVGFKMSLFCRLLKMMILLLVHGHMAKARLISWSWARLGKTAIGCCVLIFCSICGSNVCVYAYFSGWRCSLLFSSIGPVVFELQLFPLRQMLGGAKF